MTRPHCIKIPAGQTATPPCAGEWQLIGDSLYPADAATARGANLEFPRPAPAPAAAPVLVATPVPVPAIVAIAPVTPASK